MNDRMTPLPFDNLMRWALAECGAVFGVRIPYRADTSRAAPPFGGNINFAPHVEAPFGPAAGPHTQLAQNLIAAYAAGARVFELKTVQTLDGKDLPVSKPCIAAADEGYNVEWSTELTVPEAFDEYVKAWFAIKLLSREWGLGGADGFLFNMSVGYDLAGIQSPKIDAFIDGLRDASGAPSFQACAAWARENLNLFRTVDAAYLGAISPNICASITLSTLHGCPPEEIERIAAYLLLEKKLHTFVKLNPTLLGYAFARARLNAMGYDYLSFDDHHFKNDLQYADAVPMLSRLKALADARELLFGVKLTNTLPVDISSGELPGAEMYLSGRPLFALATALATKLSRSFDGQLPISYSGGADAMNLYALLACGVRPVTLATTLLKPGGYQRLTQMAESLPRSAFAPADGTDTERLEALAAAAAHDPRYRKQKKPPLPRKNGRRVPLLDCFTAPCRGGCPIGQDVPAYIRLVGEGRYLDALRVITDKNPLPMITGTICNHRCQNVCSRNDYEDAVHIRAVKRLAAERAMDALIASTTPPPATGAKVAVIGGGAAGLAAGFFAARAGLHATVFERRESAGGVVRHAIPPFRIDEEAIAHDISLIRAMGVDLRLNHPVTDLNALRAEGYRYCIVATGAPVRGSLRLETGNAVNAIDFLEQFRTDPASLTPGAHIAVVGGGNTAMDAARAAIRVPGVATVSIVYRRDLGSMPADGEELRLAQADGVAFAPLLSPVSHSDGHLVCEVMRPGGVDGSGRRAPVPTGETVRIAADTVLCAVGEKVDTAFYTALGFDENTFLAGDGKKGPATVVQAIADARAAVDEILRREGLCVAEMEQTEAPPTPAARKGWLIDYAAPETEAARCLSCDIACECCVDVCPNRANVSITVRGRPQILHLDRLCNACGNCETFCPYESAPYRDKLTLFATEKDFESSEANGFVVINRAARQCKVRASEDITPLLAAVFDRYEYLL